ncbi:BCAM0308 family protein [Azotobacter salinestris]|uniref:BCAM0308 family protein n=1 Tax=Azotobacter salinestris TaxID=69964 RepID=UPI0032DEEBC1
MDTRHDQLYQQDVHDPYLRHWHARGDALCPECGVSYQAGAGRWSWEGLDDAEHAERALCPACRRIADKAPAGNLTLAGSFVKDHTDEICNLLHNTESLEKREHPLERLMTITDEPEGLVVTTTGIHLANRLGHALEAAFKGHVDYTYSDDRTALRVRWERN